jgi:hypothetical protein
MLDIQRLYNQDSALPRKQLLYAVPNFMQFAQWWMDALMFQIYQHQITAVQGLAKCMGWQFLANSTHLGLGAVEPLGNASSCILASPIGDR